MENSAQAMPEADQLHKLNRELSILNSIAQALNGTVNLDEVLQATLAQVADLLGLQTGWVWLIREETGETYLAAAQNLPPGLIEHPILMEGSCYCLDTYQAGDMDGAANINVITCSRLKKLVDGAAGLRYHASIPLYAHRRPLGVLNVASSDWRRLSPDDLRLLYTMGDLLSISIERARLYARSTEFGAAEERNRLAREIHDTLAQGLTGIALQLETADALLEAQADTSKVRQAIQRALALTQSSLEEARRSVLDLRAGPLEGRNLAEALSSLTETTAKQTGLQISTQLIGANQPIPNRVESGLYRIAQEAIENIVRHAHASRVMIELNASPQSVELILFDNGRGFDSFEVPEGRFGLRGMLERARLLGGILELDSSPGEGTQIRVEIPIKPIP